VPSLVSLRTVDTDPNSRSAKEAYKKYLLWFPKVVIEGSPLDYSVFQTVGQMRKFSIPSASFDFVASGNATAWEGGITPPDGGVVCNDCLRYTLKAKTTISIDAPHFEHFPFDRHVRRALCASLALSPVCTPRAVS
jgi:hypothetical protein